MTFERLNLLAQWALVGSVLQYRNETFMLGSERALNLSVSIYRSDEYSNQLVWVYMMSNLLQHITLLPGGITSSIILCTWVIILDTIHMRGIENLMDPLSPAEARCQ